MNETDPQKNETPCRDPDYKLTLEVVYCLGSCGISPVALVNDKVCARLNADTLVQRVKGLS